VEEIFQRLRREDRELLHLAVDMLDATGSEETRSRVGEKDFMERGLPTATNFRQFHSRAG
jgi:hypothetical protein